MRIKSVPVVYLLIILFGFILALNSYIFIVPNNFAPAGINGIAVMIQYKLGISIGYLSLLVNIPLCVIAYFKIGKAYAIRTLAYTLSYSFFYLMFQDINLIAAFQYDANNVDTIYPVLASGVISGAISSALVLIGSCTAGTDIIARFVGKKNPELNFFWITFILNAFVALISYFVYVDYDVNGRILYNMKPVCLCLLYCYTSSFVATELHKNATAATEFIIITDKPDSISREIITRFHHSATKISATGIYTNDEKYVLICIINKNQVGEFHEILLQYPGTFAIEQKTNNIIGNFKRTASV